jgi:hypothetical protein
MALRETGSGDIPSTSPPLVSLLSLPNEILQQIAAELDDVAKGCLIFTNKHVNNAIGTESWSKLRKHGDGFEVVGRGGNISPSPGLLRYSFIKLLAKDVPSCWNICSTCKKLHPAGLIRNRIEQCRSSGEQPLIVGSLDLANYFEIYPAAVDMVTRRMLKNDHGPGTSCAELLKGMHSVPGSSVDSAPANFNLRRLTVCVSIVYIHWKASWTFTYPTEQKCAKRDLIKELMVNKFYICKHMVLQDAYLDNPMMMMDVNNYFYNRVILQSPQEPLTCRHCKTKFEVTLDSRRGTIGFDVQKSFGEYEKQLDSHWRTVTAYSPKPRSSWRDSLMGLLGGRNRYS